MSQDAYKKRFFLIIFNWVNVFYIFNMYMLGCVGGAMNRGMEQKKW